MEYSTQLQTRDNLGRGNATKTNSSATFQSEEVTTYLAEGKFYLRVIGVSLLVSIVPACFVYLLSLLPWVDDTVPGWKAKLPESAALLVDDHMSAEDLVAWRYLLFDPSTTPSGTRTFATNSTLFSDPELIPAANHAVVVGVLSLAFVTFGPAYITYYTTLIVGWRRVLLDKYYMLHMVFHGLAWPAILVSLVLSPVPFYLWFYYIDFVYFGVTFLPISFWVGFQFVYTSRNDDHGEGVVPERRTQKQDGGVARRSHGWCLWCNTTPRFRFACLYALVESAVIVSALAYTFLIFPIVVQFDDTWKICWRLFVHPLWFEVTMLLPQRLLVYHMPPDVNTYAKVLPLFHAMFHFCMFSRMLLLSVQDLVAGINLNFVTNAAEIVLRLTVLHRDRWIMQTYQKHFRGARLSSLLCCSSCQGCGADPDSGDTRLAVGDRRGATDELEMKKLTACIVNTEMLFELVGIWISPVLMICFAPFGSLFTFNSPTRVASGTMTVNIVTSSVIQLVLEIVTDMLCVVYEHRVSRLPLMSQWKSSMRWPMLLFFVYGLCFMACLGTLYTGLNLPRLLYH